MANWYCEIFEENQHEFIGTYLRELNDVYNITDFDVHTNKVNGHLYYLINFKSENKNMYDVKDDVISRYLKFMHAKYKYNDDGEQKVVTMSALKEIFDGKENDELRKQGTTFEDWIADNVRTGMLD